MDGKERAGLEAWILRGSTNRAKLRSSDTDEWLAIPRPGTRLWRKRRRAALSKAPRPTATATAVATQSRDASAASPRTPKPISPDAPGRAGRRFTPERGESPVTAERVPPRGPLQRPTPQLSEMLAPAPRTAGDAARSGSEAGGRDGDQAIRRNGDELSRWRQRAATVERRLALLEQRVSRSSDAVRELAEPDRLPPGFRR